MGASIRALRLHGSLTAIVDYVADQTLPDGEPHGQVVDYYDQGASVWEPVGRWHGRQADADGLVEVRRLELTRMVAGLSPLTGEPDGRVVRQGAVVAWDLTFTVPKSISVWWALADRSTRMAIVDAVDIAAAVTLDLADRHGAHTRVGGRDTVRVVDAEGLRAAQFRQATSRAGDPHLHVHTLIGTRVRAPDGSWHALDARWLVAHQQALGRVFEHQLAVELNRGLTVRLDWETGHPEVAGAPGALVEAWSQRTVQIDGALVEATREFTAQHGRSPTRLERAALHHQAWERTRTGKSGLPPLAELERQWRAEADAFGVESLSSPAARRDSGPAVDDRVLVADAFRLIEGERSTWTRMQLLDAMARSAASHGVALDVDRLDALADRALIGCVDLAPTHTPNGPYRADGTSQAVSAAAGRFTSDRIIAGEATITTASLIAGATEAARSRTVDVDGLDPSQADAARLLAGATPLGVVIGAAGTGKTTMLAATVNDMARRGASVLLVAPTRTATLQLAAATGAASLSACPPVAVDTIAGYRARLVNDPGLAARYGLVIVDEAGMVSTGDLAWLIDTALRNGQRLGLVGDPRQISPVGRGGMFAWLARHHDDGHVVQLDSIHRFAHGWEAQASLRLRLGEPDVVADYTRHDRVHAGTLAAAAEYAARDWLAGRPVLVSCSTNETARAVAGHIQERLADVGLVDHRETVPLNDGHRAGVGDQVVTRKNVRQRTDRGVPIANRHRCTVTAVNADGTIDVNGPHGRARLDRGYVAEHVELGYAGTVHAAQGITVDRALVLVDEYSDHETVYVGATRGRNENHLWIVAAPDEHLNDRDRAGRLTDALGRDRRDLPVLDHAAALAHADRQLADRLAREHDVAELRDLLAQPTFASDVAAWARQHQMEPQQVLQLLDDGGAALSGQAAFLIVDVGAADTVGMLTTQHPRLDLAQLQRAVYDGWRNARGTLADWGTLAAALTVPDPHAGRRRGLEQEIRSLEHRIERLGPEAPATTPLGATRRRLEAARAVERDAVIAQQAKPGRRALHRLQRATEARMHTAEQYETLVDVTARPLRRQMRQVRRDLAQLPAAPPLPPQPHPADRMIAQLTEQARHPRSRGIEPPGLSR